MRALILLFALALCGCDLTASQERATDESVCENYGFRPGSQEFAQCRMSRDQQRAAALSATINRMNRDQVPLQVVPMGAARPSVNCTSMAMGSGLSSTNCN